ncbi:MAG: response regulator [Nitrososphaera sp.]|nr:response regulator [Nitrososphaera sp.]
MKILIAEDETAISLQYRIILEERGHDTVVTENGVDCLKVYRDALRESENSSKFQAVRTLPLKAPFDLVILDFRMPMKDGLETAKEILELCPGQRIIFASAFVAETLREAAKSLHQIVELLQKPFGLDYLVEIVEDIGVYRQLAALNVKVKELKNHNLTLSELVGLLEGVKKLQSVITDPAR